MNPEVYSNGLSYEIFICRAHRCYPNPRTGAYAGHYHAIYWAEHGLLLKKKSPEKVLEQVKEYVSKAITRFLKSRLKHYEREKLLLIQSELEYVYTEPTLFELIDRALEVTIRLKEYSFK